MVMVMKRIFKLKGVGFISPADREIAKRHFRDVLNDDVRDGGQPGTLAAPVDELLQGRLRPTHGGFDVTFRGIPDPACERQSDGCFFGGETVGNALHSTFYDEMDGWHGEQR
jgi:hypothetical protein